MSLLKKSVAVIALIATVAVCALPAAAAKGGLNEFDKSSQSMYLDDNLKMTEQTILTFDDMTNQSVGSITNKGKKGNALAVSSPGDNGHLSVINVPQNSFEFAINDKFKQTIKMWVYVNDIDLLVCDHDSVYDHPQDGSGTLHIAFQSKGGTAHNWQHTFYGSGWHEIELSFFCHNVSYDSLDNINYDCFNGLTAWCSAKAGLELRFDEMRLVTYSNPNYKEPEAPYGGRWISTLDYDALDGANLTEWYGSYFDLEDKTQGSSSLAITGHKENVDHRVCIGVKDVPVNYLEDTLCFDLYLSDLKLVGTHWEMRYEHNAQAAHYAADFSAIRTKAYDENGKRTSLKAGWNHIRIPLKSTKANIGEAYTEKFADKNLVLTQMVFYVQGTGESDKENYVIKYDNMYVAKTSDLLGKDKPVAQSSSVAESSDVISSEDGAGENDGPNTGLVIGIVVAVAVVAVVVIILISKKKK
ncbi:MAG: hypothetical protein J6K98_02875 [Clostridia bacterium]|nr:hypothetical protein [Clostridia bacterium]